MSVGFKLDWGKVNPDDATDSWVVEVTEDGAESYPVGRYPLTTEPDVVSQGKDVSEITEIDITLPEKWDEARNEAATFPEKLKVPEEIMIEEAAKKPLEERIQEAAKSSTASSKASSTSATPGATNATKSGALIAQGSTSGSAGQTTPTATFGELDNNGIFILAHGTETSVPWVSCKLYPTNRSQSECIVRDPPSSSNTGLKAAAGVLGGLFLLSLGALLFLLFRARKHKRANNTPIIYENPKSDDTARNIEDEVRTPLQPALAGIHAGTALRTTPVLDDRAVAARYNSVSQELKDWALTHFRSGTGMLPEGEYESLLAVPKTRVLVIRALAAGGLWRAAGEGECVFSGSVKRVEAEMARILGDGEFNRWRVGTYTALEASEIVSTDAVAAVAQRICTMLAPLADEGTELKRYHSLYPIVESAVNLTLDLEKQQARFIIDIDTQAGATFNSRLMDDVLQEYETTVDGRGALSNPLEGRRVNLVVTPPLVKYGNELAENYDEMTVVVKGKVLAR